MMVTLMNHQYDDVDDDLHCVAFGKVHIDDSDFDESSMMMLMITYIV